MAGKEIPRLVEVSEKDFVNSVAHLNNLTMLPVINGATLVQFHFDTASRYMFERKKPGDENPRAVYSSPKDKLEKTAGFYAVALVAAEMQGNKKVEKTSKVGLQVATDRMKRLYPKVDRKTPGS